MAATSSCAREELGLTVVLHRPCALSDLKSGSAAPAIIIFAVIIELFSVLKRLGEERHLATYPELGSWNQYISTAIYMVLLGGNGLDSFLRSWGVGITSPVPPYNLEPTWSSLTDLEEMRYICVAHTVYLISQVWMPNEQTQTCFYVTCSQGCPGPYLAFPRELSPFLWSPCHVAEPDPELSVTLQDWESWLTDLCTSGLW